MHIYIIDVRTVPGLIIYGDLTTISPTIISEEKKQTVFVQTICCQRGEHQVFLV